MQGYGAIILHAGENPLEAEIVARSAAQAAGKTYISPYNDPLVVAGQGTISIELLQQLGPYRRDLHRGGRRRLNRRRGCVS